MIPVLVMLLAVLGWTISVFATIWYLRTFYHMHQEMKAIRRYLQALYDRMEGR